MTLHPIDRLETALSRPGCSPAAAVQELVREDLPTAVEFIALRWFRWRNYGEDLLTTLPSLQNWLSLGTLRSVADQLEILNAGTKVPASATRPSPQGAGLHQLPPLKSHEWQPGGAFVRFQESFRAALRRGGVDNHYADALAGALAEMASNAVEHAESPAAPIGSFEVTSRSWSFGVTDVGRGALASIRDNPAYAGLESEREALELILREGVSRTGQPGRGLGFTTVFKALVGSARQPALPLGRRYDDVDGGESHGASHALPGASLHAGGVPRADRRPDPLTPLTPD